MYIVLINLWWYVAAVKGVLKTDNFIILCYYIFFFQAEDGIRDAQESRGLGDVYKRQSMARLSRNMSL